MAICACMQSGAGVARPAGPGGGRPGPGAGGLRRSTCRSALPAQLVAADPIRDTAANLGASGCSMQRAPHRCQRCSCKPCPGWRASLSRSPVLVFFFFFPSCLLMSDGLRSPGGASMAGGPAGGSAAPRGRPAPRSPARPCPARGPVAGGRRELHSL